MTKIIPLPPGITPEPGSIYSYIDRAQLWVKQPLSKGDLDDLRALAGKKLRIWSRPMPYMPSLKQRFTLFQPSRDLLQHLRPHEPYINAVEIALDWVYPDELRKDRAFEFTCQGVVKSHHREQGIRWFNGITRYSGPRGAPNVMAIYGDKHSKVTGEVDCVHLDWRISRRGAIERANLDTIDKLLNLDFRKFWDQRLKLLQVDGETLGRLYHNRLTGSQRRKALIHGEGKFPYYVDRRMAGTLIQALQLNSAQQVIDHFKRDIRIERCLMAFEHEALLPNAFGEGQGI